MKERTCDLITIGIILPVMLTAESLIETRTGLIIIGIALGAAILMQTLKENKND